MNPIEKIAVVGSGNMGSGIAQKFATEGFSVLLLDIDEAALNRGRTAIERTLAEGVERKIFRSDQAEQIRERAREGYEQAHEVVRRRPAESVAVAFGTGLLVGVIVGLIARSK